MQASGVSNSKIGGLATSDSNALQSAGVERKQMFEYTE